MAVEEKGVMSASGTRELDLRIRICKMDENEHCRLCRVLHESAAEKSGLKRWKQDYVCQGRDLTRLGRRRMVTLWR
jgi:hypothetical protein